MFVHRMSPSRERVISHHHETTMEGAYPFTCSSSMFPLCPFVVLVVVLFILVRDDSRGRVLCNFLACSTWLRLVLIRILVELEYLDPLRCCDAKHTSQKVSPHVSQWISADWSVSSDG